MSQAPAKRVLIVGAGLTGSAVGALLRESAFAAAGGGGGGIEIEVWDKSRGAGGRAATTRFGPPGSGSADTGLQYLSTTADPLHPFYTAMLEAGAIAPMTARLGGNNPKYMDPTLRHFVSVGGASGLAKHLLGAAGLAPTFGNEVANLTVVQPAEGDPAARPKWRATTATGTTQEFDGVVLTPPVPQILAMGGDVQAKLAADPDLLGRLQKVSYSARWALALHFGPEAWAAVAKLDFDARYVGKDESTAICYLSIDQLKRGRTAEALRDAGEGPVVLVHSGVPWSLKHGASTAFADEDEALRPRVLAELLKQTTALLPDLMANHTPAGTKLQKWRYSQVYKGLVGGTGSAVISEAPLLVVAGDGFTSGSGFDHCVESATAASVQVLSHI